MQPTATNESTRTPPSRSRFARSTLWLTLFLILAAAALARFAHLVRKPFWFDECFSVEIARIDWGNFLHLLWWREANMSLYYVLLRIWLHFGQSEFFIRSLSVVLALATLPAIYWVARLLYDRKVALGATALLAINAYHIRYSQEARSYTLFALLATLSSGFLIAWLRQPTRRNWRGYVLTSSLAVYAHFYALLLLAAHIIALLWTGLPRARADQNEHEHRRHIRRAWIVIGIAVLPVLVFVAKTGAGPIRWIQRPGLLELLRFASDFSNGLPIIYFAACLAALIPLKRKPLAHDGGWEAFRVHFLMICFLFPILLTILLSFARPVFLPRYMIFCLPALLILSAAGLLRVPPKWLGAVLLGGTIILSARMIPYVYEHDFDTERDASGAATNFILDHSQPGDAILFHVANARVPYEFFRSLRAGENTASPKFSGTLGPEIVYPHHAAGLDYHDFTGKPTAEFVRSVAPQHQRIWLMLMNNGTAEKPDPTTVMLNEVLPEYFPKMQRWQLARVEVRLYSRE